MLNDQMLSHWHVPTFYRESRHHQVFLCAVVPLLSRPCHTMIEGAWLKFKSSTISNSRVHEFVELISKQIFISICEELIRAHVVAFWEFPIAVAPHGLITKPVMPATATQNGLFWPVTWLENHPFVPRHIGQDFTSPFLMGWTSIDPDFDVYEAYISGYISGWPIHHTLETAVMFPWKPRSPTLLSLTTIWMPCRLQVGNSVDHLEVSRIFRWAQDGNESRTSRTV